MTGTGGAKNNLAHISGKHLRVMSFGAHHDIHLKQDGFVASPAPRGSFFPNDRMP